MSLLMFPGLSRAKWGHINLDQSLRLLIRRGLLPSIPYSGKSPYLDASECTKLVACIHSFYGVDFSYGSWRDNRSKLWRGSYLEKRGNFIHVGTDFCVPAGTEVRCPFEGTVLHSDTDFPEEHGWGSRTFIFHEARKCVVAFAHLGKDLLRAGTRLQAGAAVGLVGGPGETPWWPHLHAQVLTYERYVFYESEAFANFDGYATEAEIEGEPAEFPDPLPILCPF